MKKLAFSLLGLVILTPVLVSPFDGRYVRFEHLLPEFNGKPVISIFSILQDREGFIWFGTGTGLAKYDGYNFTFYFPLSREGTTSSPVTVYPIFEDSAGELWIGTNGEGLFRFIKEKETFVQYKYVLDAPDSPSRNIILALQEDKKGNLWAGMRSGSLCRFDKETESFTQIPLGAETGAIWDILVDRTGMVWVGTDRAGLFKLNPVNAEIVHFQHAPDDPLSLGSNTIWSIFEDDEGAIWVGTKGGGLNRYLRDDERFARFYGNKESPNDLAHNIITAVCEDEGGKLWIGTASSGLRIFNKKTGEYVICRNDPQDPDSLNNDAITSIQQDTSGVMWIGTTRGGVNKSLCDQVKFIHYKHNPHNPRSINHNDVRSLYVDGSGILWVGTKQGLNRVDKRSGVVTHFSHDLSNANSLSHDCVQAIEEDKAGRIWLGTEDGGLNRLDSKTGIFTHYKNVPGDQNSLSNNRIYVMRAEKQNPDILWMGTHHGLNKLDTRANRFTIFLHNPSDSSSLSGNIIRAIYEDSPGHLWIGTTWGLNRMDKATGKCVRYTADIKNPPGKSINDNIINSIYEDRAGMLWVGTDGGINRFDRSRGEWKYYTQKEGLPGNSVYGILEDEAGNLWVSTNRGLSRFRPETEVFTSYGIQDGIQGYQYNPGAYFKSPDGKMFFGGVNGYNSFYPQDVKSSPFVPPIVWTAFYRHNQKVKLGQSLSSLRNVTLSYKYGFVTFEFSALCFINPSMNQYAYKLEGRDKDWVYAGPNRSVSFSDLSRGEYVLRIKGANADGVWNEEGLSIQLKVIPPFWRTGWFVILVALIVLAFVVSWFRMRRKFKSVHIDYEENIEKVLKKYKLTPREQEIIRLIIQGSSNRDIEKKLFISDSTVRNHIYNIYQKLNVQNRIELINLFRKP